MKYVYLLQSVSHPAQRYTGLTTDVDKRLSAHIAGQSIHDMGRP
jgi:predicted GIY-YIG superfamily endonuclease